MKFQARPAVSSEVRDEGFMLNVSTSCKMCCIFLKITVRSVFV